MILAIGLVILLILCYNDNAKQKLIFFKPEKVCVFLRLGKNADALFRHILDRFMYKFCLATIGVEAFFVRQLWLAHFLAYKGSLWRIAK